MGRKLYIKFNQLCQLFNLNICDNKANGNERIIYGIILSMGRQLQIKNNQLYQSLRLNICSNGQIQANVDILTVNCYICSTTKKYKYLQLDTRSLKQGQFHNIIKTPTRTCQYVIYSYDVECFDDSDQRKWVSEMLTLHNCSCCL